MTRVLVTGATGYVGARLTPRLLDMGHSVRCLVRSPGRLAGAPWTADVEVCQGDVLRPGSLAAALDAVDIAYYLIHSISARDFQAVDRRGAELFATAAREAGVGRIVYLGGPAPTRRRSSAHLRSREEVARILLDSGVPTVVLRAAIILGSGSTSFEMLRYLTERLPVMVTPWWVNNLVQPIAIRDVLHYLLAAAALPATVHGDFDIGGPDVLSFADMMRRYARIVGLPPRVIVPVRPLTPRLSSYWVGLVTPVPGRLARPLVESLVHEAVCRDRAIARHVPDPPGGLTDVDTALRLALARPIGDEGMRWSGATAPSDPLPTDPGWAGGTVYTDTRTVDVAASSATLRHTAEDIGGRTRWLRRGDEPDHWRIAPPDIGPLRWLHAATRVSGRAWLELRLVERGDRTRCELRTVFLPRGLLGHLFWLGVTPVRAVVLGGLVRAIAGAAERTGVPEDG